MVNVLRRWSQPIMIIITVLVIVSFTYFGQNFYGPSRQNQAIVTLYGKDISLEAFQRQGRRVGVFQALGGEYMTALGFQQADAAMVARSFVLEHEADQLGLGATEQEKIDAFNSLRALQGEDGKVDPAKYEQFKQRVLNPQGFSESDFDTVFLAGEVRAKKLRELVGSTVTASEQEVKANILKQRQTTEASYIAFRPADFRKDLKATEEEIKKRYEEQKALLKTPEQRKVRYAAFTLANPADAKPLETKERNAQLEKLATMAYTFRDELEQKKGTFADLAKKHGANLAETDFFSADSVPVELEGAPQIGQAAFSVTKDAPFSQHIMLQKGTYVLELLEIKAPEDRKFEEVKGELENQIVSSKAAEIAHEKAKETRGKLADLLKAGKTFADASKELGLKVDEHPAIGGFQRTPPGEFTESVRPAIEKLAPGEISEVVTDSASNTPLIVHVDYRSPLDEKDLAAAIPSTKKRIEDGFPPFMPGMRFAVFQNWLAERARLAGIDKFLEASRG